MSAMEQMLGNMLKSILPPEVMSMITPEKISEMGSRVNQYLQAQTEFQGLTSSMLSSMNDKLDFIIGKDIDDDNGNNYNSDGRAGNNIDDGK